VGRIWLIGGTSESAVLAEKIACWDFPCTVSVTTSAALALYPDVSSLRVWVGSLSAQTLLAFFHQEQITAILDASHPYAVEISQLAIAFALERQIPYLRYERPRVEEEGVQGAGGREKEEGVQGAGCRGEEEGRVIYLDNFNHLICGNYLENQRVLLTVGYRLLHLFLPWQERCVLFARLLPSQPALEAAFRAGFTSERIICLRPPIPYELEKELWRHWDISLVVTKASGSVGGEDIKRQVAAQLGVPLVVIARPDMKYPQQTSDLEEALEFCRQCCTDAEREP
jgi:precorrin-6A/cobalt-precorrin-6A reductase